MAGISTGQSKIGIVAGSTWGTAAAMSGEMSLRGRLTHKSARGEHNPADIGFGNFFQTVVSQEDSLDVTLMAEMAFDSLIAQAIAMFLGEDTSTETTGAQGDYAHVMKMTDDNDGHFATLGYFYDKSAGKVIEIPSCKFHTLTIKQQRMGVGEITLQGIGDRLVVSSPTNDYSTINGLTAPAFELGVLGGTNHYFRMNAASGDALDSGDDKQIVGYTLTLQRPFDRDFVLRAANTRYSLEPKQLSPATGTLELNLPLIDTTQVDIFSLWNLGTLQKAELYFDGTQIGSGVNRSWKIQLPSLKCLQFPAGTDLPNNNARMRPTLTFRVLQAASAPNGMTGITNYVALTSVDEHVAAYV